MGVFIVSAILFAVIIEYHYPRGGAGGGQVAA